MEIASKKTAAKTKIVKLKRTNFFAVIDDNQVPEDMVFHMLNNRFVMGVCPENDGRTHCRLFRQGADNIHHSLATLSLDSKVLGPDACVTAAYYD